MRKAGWACTAGILAAVAAVIFGIALVILCISGNGGLLAEEMLRAAPPEKTGLPETEYPGMGRMIAGYLTGSKERFQYVFSDSDGNRFQCFQPHEEAHMADCRTLISLDRTVCIAGFVLFALLTTLGLSVKTGRKSFRQGILWGLRILVGVAAVLLIWALIDFDGFFVSFHRVAFTNDGWLLNARTDLLMRLMPVSFFIRLGIRGLLWSLIIPTMLEAAARILPAFLRKRV